MRCASVRCVAHQFDILQQLLTGFYTQLAVDVFIVVLQGIFGNTKLADNCLGRAAWAKLNCCCACSRSC